MQVDNYKPQEYNFNIKESADAQFNNIQYMYIGRNESMTEGFTGCISRVEFDDIYPLKLLFQMDGPSSVRSLGCKYIQFVLRPLYEYNFTCCLNPFDIGSIICKIRFAPHTVPFPIMLSYSLYHVPT